MILLAIAALMGLTALALVVYPLLGIERFGHLSHGAEAETLTNPAGHRDRMVDMSEGERAARQALLDVDFDYRLGNLDEQDYNQLRDRYEERALLGLKARYEREQELDKVIEQQLAVLKSGSVGTGNRRAMTPTVQSPTVQSPTVQSPTVQSPMGTQTGGATASSHGATHTVPHTVPRGPRQRRRKGG